MTEQRRAVVVLACLWALVARAGAASWTATTPLPDPFNGHALAYSSGRLFHTGGMSDNGGILDGNKVFSAPVDGDGAVGAWAPALPLPEAIFYHASVTVGGRVYVLGGFHYTEADGIVVSAKAYGTTVGSDGAIGAWQTVTPLPQPVFFLSAAAWNGRIYVTGGWNGSQLVSGVFSAEVNADGSLGPWIAQKPLPEAVYTHAAVSNGTLYVLGGAVNGGNDIQSTVYFAKINADGSLADWAQTSPLPAPVSNHGAVVANGRVIVLGGWNGSAPTDGVESSPVLGDGSLGPWSADTALPRSLYLLASAASPSHVFVTGGIDSSSMRAEVYSSPLPPPVILPPPPPSDSLPPRTTLAFGSPFHAGAPFISPRTPLSLVAVDDALTSGDAAGVGVASTQWAVDDGAFAAYSAPVTIPSDGPHWIRFFSADSLNHAESAQASPASVDGTAPVSSLAIGSPQAVLYSGDVIVGPATPLSVSAADPVVNGAASGVLGVYASVNGAPLAEVSAPFILPASDGAHTVAINAKDNVDNAETPHSVTVHRDGAAPATTLSFSVVPHAGPSGPIYGAATTLSFAASDPGATAAGVHHTQYAFNGGAASVYAGPFGAAEGAHSLSYHSVDNVDNAEPARAVSFSVDATPPLTTLSVNGDGATLFGQDVLTASASLSLSAADPLSAGVASGVSALLYSVDGGADQAYSAPFQLGAGRHTVSYGAKDNAGNVETRNVTTVTVGSFLTDALSATGSISLSGKAKVVGVVRSNAAFTASGKSSVAGDVAAMTVTLSGQSTISGTVTQGQATVASPSYDLAAARVWAQAHNNNAAIPARFFTGNALALGGHERLELPAGDYYFAGLRLRGQSELTVSGRVNIFLDGPLSISGGGELNSTGDAANLWVVSAYGGADAYEGDGDDSGAYGAYISGQGHAALNLYAPLSDVRVSGNGAFSGRVLAKSASLSGKAIQPSTTVLPPPLHRGPLVHRPTHGAGSGPGTAGGGHAGGRRSALASCRLGAGEPNETRSGAVVPALTSAPSGGVEAAPVKRTASSRMPSFSLSRRAAFAPVAARGGAVRAKDRAAVVIPDGAVTGGLGITVSPPKADVIEQKRRSDVESRKKLVAASNGVQYGPEGTHFAKPVTLELPYDRASLPAGVTENALAVHYWNPATGDWEKLRSTVDTSNQIVRAQTSHFSLYQLFGGGSPAGAPSMVNDPAFKIHAGYAFPNPSRSGAPVVFRVQPGQADGVSVRVYDVAGRLVHQSSNFINRGSFDDGNGFGAQFTFEHTWDVSGVGSGVYTFVVSGHKAGTRGVHASGKAGVVK